MAWSMFPSAIWESFDAISAIYFFSSAFVEWMEPTSMPISLVSGSRAKSDDRLPEAIYPISSRISMIGRNKRNLQNRSVMT